MILILTRPLEHSSDEVASWITALNGNFVRINDTDFRDFKSGFKLVLNNECESVNFEKQSLQFAIDDISIIWYRKWTSSESFLSLLNLADNKLWGWEIANHLYYEVSHTGNAFFNLLNDKKWFDHPFDVRKIRKSETLSKAKKCGLQIPRSIITNCKQDVCNFLKAEKRIISKAISEMSSFEDAERAYILYTKELTEDLLDKCPDYFYPTLFQKLVEKKFDIRVFYLDGKCYSMAILSQKDPQTSIDFRNYNYHIPNRFIPYKLPLDIEDGIRKLMAELNLKSGSLDFIYNLNKEFIFLEVNPVGQFGMTSFPCNYKLEKKIAQYLIRHDQK